MTIDWAEWGPALIVFAIGLVVTGFVIRPTRSKRFGNEAESDGIKQDLVSRKEVALEELRALDSQKGKLNDADYEKERRELIEMGADALRRLDECSSPVVPAEAEAPPENKTAWRWLALGFGSVALALSLFNMASYFSRQRIGNESITGVDLNVPAPKVMAQELEKQLAEDPSDIQAINEIGAAALMSQDLPTAQRANQTVLKLDPKNVDARINHAVLTAMVGMPARGLKYLDEVIADAPDSYGAHMYKGMIALESNRPDLAVPALERAIEIQGETPELAHALQRARTMAEKPGESAP
ncbi:MAG: tetratricopeptide repeat protein [Proteobacteria bacterium]|jgi:cytochrome c-type biogenesis protein CcmH/NrfG|nr:tetratricopeptide repeat protein [Pseudomonadota bacterium]